MTKARKSRPGANRAAVNLDSGTTVPNPTDIYPDHTGLVAGVWVAVVQVRGTHLEPRYRRRVYWNLPSAQRSLDRAAMEGLDASIVLCQLIPAGGDK